jgi:putative zinc finger/helix-turn-helix YgiT family protein
MTEAVGSHDYRECGLPVRLRGVVLRTCVHCGNDEVVVPDIEELHRLIARTVMRKPHGLSGPEVRFLRKWMGHSGRDLAAIMGVTPETVSRWETGAAPVGATADRLLRLLVAQSEPRDAHAPEDLRNVQSDTTASTPLVVNREGDGWRPAA